MIFRFKINRGFSLVEVVLALGVISFAIVAILGVIPIGLRTGHSAQDETRAAQIAENVLGSLSSQAPEKFPNLTIRQPAGGTASVFSYGIALDTAREYNTMAADNDGRLIALNQVNEAVKYPYQVLVEIAPDPPGFDPNIASQVTVRVVSPPSLDPTQPLRPNQTARTFVRIISKY
jgi:hypothetical protein